jgi:hypothetical protein
MKLKNYFFLLLLAVFSFSANAQVNEEQGVESYGTLTEMVKVPSLASQNLGPYVDNSVREARDRRSLANQVVIGKDTQNGDDYFANNRSPFSQSFQSKAPSLVFDAYTSGSQPTDPSMAVGPNHVFVVYNTGFAIYDKSGNIIGGQNPVTSIFSGGGCCDLTVSYDKAADRFVVGYLFSSNGQVQVAISDGPDPTTSTWTRWTIPGVNDYNKLSVWSDGYYMTANTSSSNKVWAMNRDDMIAGVASPNFQTFNLPGLATSGFYSPQALNVSDDNMPAPGGATIVYLQDNAWGGVSVDHVKYWTVDVDWTNPANSGISAATQINTTPFTSVFDGGSFSNLPQPGGTTIDALQATIMNQAQFRKFAGHNSAVFNFVVDTDPSGGKLAGVRWFEFRQASDNQPWSLFQEGTYNAPDGRHAWHASMIMNGAGDIGMGYTSMSGPTTPSTVRVSSYYTGRFASDIVNTMTVAENLIANGSSNIPGTRYGDYSKIDIDPSDDNTFWFINEYMNSGRKGVVGVFQLAPAGPDDIGVSSIDSPNSGLLTNAESVTVTINNFGSNDITNPTVQYTVDGGTPVVENYSGTITAGATDSYTFTATADLSTLGTYAIASKTNLAGDTNPGNDETTKNVTSGVQVCTPTATAGCNLDGIKMFELNTISVDDGGIGCNTEPAGSPQGYADRTDLSTDLSNDAGSNVYTIRAQQNWSPAATPPFTPGDEGFAVWIDFDDSGTFESSELLINSAFQTSEALEDFTLTIPVGAPDGSHRLRAKAIDITGSDILTNPCDDFAYGEVHDYTVNIGTLGFEDVAISQAELIVLSLDNNQFDISLVTSFDDIASISIYNMLGQKLAFNNLEKQGDRYNYKLDMSYATAGIYLVKIGDQATDTYQTAKIIVK